MASSRSSVVRTSGRPRPGPIIDVPVRRASRDAEDDSRARPTRPGSIRSRTGVVAAVPGGTRSPMSAAVPDDSRAARRPGRRRGRRRRPPIASRPSRISNGTRSTADRRGHPGAARRRISRRRPAEDQRPVVLVLEVGLGCRSGRRSRTYAASPAAAMRPGLGDGHRGRRSEQPADAVARPERCAGSPAPAASASSAGDEQEQGMSRPG